MLRYRIGILVRIRHTGVEGKTLVAVGLLVLLGVLSACGAASDPLVRGKQSYDKLGCNACHAIAGQGGTTGPDQTHLAANAAQRIKDPSYKGNASDAAGYIRESIIQPGAYIVPGFPDNIMPTTFGHQLSAQELDDLVAFLLTLK